MSASARAWLRVAFGFGVAGLVLAAATNGWQGVLWSVWQPLFIAAGAWAIGRWPALGVPPTSPWRPPFFGFLAVALLAMGSGIVLAADGRARALSVFLSAVGGGFLILALLSRQRSSSPPPDSARS